MRALWRYGAMGAVIALLSACSTSDFKQPIADFSTATTAASKSFNDYADALDKLKHDQTISEVATTGKFLVEDGCERRAKKCVLSVSDGQTATPLKSPLLANTRKLMAAIGTYAKNLEAIALPDDVAAIKTAADAIPASLIGVAKAADGLNAQQGQKTNLMAQVTALATPAGDIVSIALTKYADYRKLEALRDATARMERIFPEAMQTFAEVGYSNFTLVRSNLFEKLVRVREAYIETVQARNKALAEEKKKPPQTDKEKSELAKLKAGLAKDIKDAAAAYESAADSYNVALTTKPESVFTKLGEIHTTLVETLRNPNPDFKSVFAQIQQIGELAAKIASDAQALDKALRSPPGA